MRPGSSGSNTPPGLSKGFRAACALRLRGLSRCISDLRPHAPLEPVAAPSSSGSRFHGPVEALYGSGGIIRHTFVERLIRVHKRMRLARPKAAKASSHHSSMRSDLVVGTSELGRRHAL